jgi:hypothetical protein
MPSDLKQIAFIDGNKLLFSWCQYAVAAVCAHRWEEGREREREGVGEGEREREVGQDDDDNDRTVPPLHIHLSSLGNMFLRTWYKMELELFIVASHNSTNEREKREFIMKYNSLQSNGKNKGNLNR